MAAPLQGLTEAEWRSAHFGLFGATQGEVEYYTPFIRVERGAVRGRDLRDFTSWFNRGINVTPQIIFRDASEWSLLVDTLAGAGADRVDMNLGCPFTPQVRKGRGAGMLLRVEELARVADAMKQYASTLRFSVKMRLGVTDPSESLDLSEILNEMPLRHVTIHPRTALQQYRGELLLDELAEFRLRLRHPVIFNGGISTPGDIAALSADYDGVMVGRGLLARPTIFAEYRSGRDLTCTQQVAAFVSMLHATGAALGQRLCGDTQLRDKMKAYWEYAPASMDRRTVKYGRKNGTILT